MADPGVSPVDRILYRIGRSWADAHFTPETQLLGPDVRGAAAYALLLLAGGGLPQCRKAEAILLAVLGYQETDPANPHFGLFKASASAEGFTDPNWAAFCGSYLMHTDAAYGDRLTESCRRSVRDAILRACAFITKRDVVPGYTNIALLSASVLTVAGEIYGSSEYQEEGRRKVRELARYIDLTGGFQEYNSPTYYGVCLSALCWMGMFLRDGEVRDLSLRIQARLWRTIAAHYHAPTSQLAGPYGRAYGNTLQRYAAALKYYLPKVLGESFPLGNNEAHGHDTAYAGLAALQEVSCPEDAAERMRSADCRGTIREAVWTDGRPLDSGYSGPFGQMTTCLAPSYALGTINASETWEQRRDLLLHWVGPDGQPAALTQTVHANDGSIWRWGVRFWGVQKEGKALALIDLSALEDREVSSFSLVFTLEVQDLPRIWVGSNRVEDVPHPIDGNSPIHFRSGEISIGIRHLARGFPGFEARGEIRQMQDGLEVVLDLYRGGPIRVSGNALALIPCLYAFEVRPIRSDREHDTFRRDLEASALSVAVQDRGIGVQWQTSDALLVISPAEEDGPRRYVGIVDGIPVRPVRLFRDPV